MTIPAMLGRLHPGGPAGPDTRPKIEFEITTSGTPESFTLPISFDPAGYNFTAYWGDGDQDNITAWDQVEKTHSYATPGPYIVTLRGLIPRFNFNIGGDRLAVTAILAYEDTGMTNANGMWAGCSNAIGAIPPFDDLANVTDFTSMFRLCAVTGPIPSFDPLINATMTREMFWGCSNLGGTIPPLTSLSAVTSTQRMFSQCSVLSGAVPDLSALTNLNIASDMFSQCSGLTGNVPAFPPGSTVTTCNGMYNSCTGLDGTITSFAGLEICTNVGNLFNGCWNLLAPVPSLAPLANVITANNMFASTFGMSGPMPDLAPMVALQNAASMFFRSGFDGTIPSLQNNTALTTINAIYDQASGLTDFAPGTFNSTSHPNVTNFANACRNLTQVGPGTSLPEWWVDFPAAPTTTNCFSGCVNADNFGSVPTAWGGP